jgi:Putative RNA methylase family UPF0020
MARNATRQPVQIAREYWDSEDVGIDGSWTRALTVANDYTLHQLAPYIGRMKTSMARTLVYQWTQPGGLIVDPFCGCGVIALEAAAERRRVAAGDWNPYATLLTKAKLFPPKSQRAAEHRLKKTWALSRRLMASQDLRRVPKWVRRFFHPQTLRSALAFRDACVGNQDSFLLACLLGILHHQRPGFLSYPSSHLVPYLRNRNFPRHRFRKLYEERDVLSRLQAKVRRTYRRVPDQLTTVRRVLDTDARSFPRMRNIDAVITSPPYMNELDYVRDNRLRLWFIDKSLPNDIETVGTNRKKAFEELMTTVCCRLAPGIRSRGTFVLVIGDATRGGGRRGRTAAIVQSIFAREKMLSPFRLVQRTYDRIPDIRRSRRECSGTKSETILVYQKN